MALKRGGVSVRTQLAEAIRKLLKEEKTQVIITGSRNISASLGNKGREKNMGREGKVPWCLRRRLSSVRTGRHITLREVVSCSFGAEEGAWAEWEPEKVALGIFPHFPTHVPQLSQGPWHMERKRPVQEENRFPSGGWGNGSVNMNGN